MEISKFTNRYSLSKTLRFKLIPQGETEKNIALNNVLEKDEKISKDYEIVKEIIDRCHIAFIENKLSDFSFGEVSLNHFADVYYAGNKDDLKLARADMIKKIGNYLQSGEDYKDLTDKKMITDIAPQFAENDEELASLDNLKNFWTYFTNYNTNRKNMYTSEEKENSIAYRVVKENLPRFLDNLKAWKVISEKLPKEEIEQVDNELYGVIGLTSKDIFNVKSFDLFISQSGIDKFNRYIGGYTNSEISSKKIQGLNEKINLYCQATEIKMPMIKPLYEQILCKGETVSVSFIPETFKSDNELISSIKNFYEVTKEDFAVLHKTVLNIKEYDLSKIYVHKKSLTNLSKYVFDDWDKFNRGITKEEDSYSLECLTEIFDKNPPDENKIDFCTAIMDKEKMLYEAISVSFDNVKDLLNNEYPQHKKLAKDDNSIDLIKAFLDSLKDYQRFISMLLGSGEEAEKDLSFYGFIDEHYKNFMTIIRLYDKVRNYITKKPYSTDKYKLNFDTPTLLNGWVDSHTELSDNATQYGGYLFRKKNSIGEYDYYLGVSKNCKLFREFMTVNEDDKSEYERLDYYQPKSTTIYGSSYKGKQSYKEDKREILDIMADFASCQSDKKFVNKIIDYCSKENATPSGCFTIYEKYPDIKETLICNKKFEECNQLIIENLKNTIKSLSDRLVGAMEIVNKNYTLFVDIMNDIENIVKNKVYLYFHVSKNEMKIALNDSKKPLYLFKISNKDLSYAETFSKGKRKNRGNENLHTLFFKQLMSGNQNVIDIGTGSLYYREKSLPPDITHPANQPITCKRDETRSSIFNYDLIKDKRYSENQFMFHLSLTLNYKDEKADEKKLRKEVNESIKNTENQYIIGIDRGERNLLYYTIIDEKGNIIDQNSLNVIDEGRRNKTDYHDLLVKRKAKMDSEKQEWKIIGGIKELKEGYLSQAVHEICKLVENRNAIIVMELLNKGFKNSRSKVEFSVYQKFEKMLSDKLSYLADKKKEPTEIGGILNAYQLANPTTSFSDMRGQNGIIFYIPAWCTSNIDPTTGFVDLLKPKYENVEKSVSFFESFDAIRFNEKDNLFEFVTDYSKFARTESDYKKEWIICTNGERILKFRNPNINNKWDTKSINLTSEFKELFDEYKIDYKQGDIKSIIINQKEKKFFEKLTKLLALTLQMRNSISNSTKSEDDYLISPIRNSKGEFYDSRKSDGKTTPKDADANGAYNIARKGLMVVDTIKNAKDLDNISTAISNADWLKYAQTHNV